MSTHDAPQYAQTTHGIAVRVLPFYLEEKSKPDEGRYLWAYRVTIENQGARTVQLLRRTWRITDARGRLYLVEGEGVIGAQPILAPGEIFEYTSSTPLETPSGIMTGQYHMITLSTDAPTQFDVAIPTFSLDSPHQPGRVH